MDYGVFPDRKILYGLVGLKDDPFVEGNEGFWWSRSLLDNCTDTYYRMPETPYGIFGYHVTLTNCKICYHTWDTSFYVLKPFIDEEVDNVIDAANYEMQFITAYPEYREDALTTQRCKACNTIEDYFPIRKKALSYNMIVEYDRRIDNYIDDNEYESLLLEYQKIHLYILKLAFPFDDRLIEFDDVTYYLGRQNVKFDKWTRTTLDKILTIIKSMKYKNHSLDYEEWSHILLSFGEGFMEIFGNYEYWADKHEELLDGHKPEVRTKEGHYGSFLDDQDNDYDYTDYSVYLMQYFTFIYDIAIFKII